MERAYGCCRTVKDVIEGGGRPYFQRSKVHSCRRAIDRMIFYAPFYTAMKNWSLQLEIIQFLVTSEAYPESGGNPNAVA